MALLFRTHADDGQDAGSRQNILYCLLLLYPLYHTPLTFLLLPFRSGFQVAETYLHLICIVPVRGI